MAPVPLTPGTPVRHREAGAGAPIGLIVGRVAASAGGRARYRVSWPDGRTSVVEGADLDPVQTRSKR